jgi:hypothetical protein
MPWTWEDMETAINDSHGNFAAFVAKLPRSEVQRLIGGRLHFHRLLSCGCFAIDRDRAAAVIYDDIQERGRFGVE